MWVPPARRQWVKSACQRSPALFGGEADVGRFWPFMGLGLDESCGGEVAADGCHGDLEAVVVLQVPGDGVRSGVESFAGEFGA